MSKTIVVPAVNIAELRKQRDYLLDVVKVNSPEELHGVVNLLDAMLDIAEGHDQPAPLPRTATHHQRTLHSTIQNKLASMAHDATTIDNLQVQLTKELSK